MDYAYIDPGTGYTIASFFGWLIAFGLGFIGLFTAFHKKIFKFFRNHKKLLILVAAVVAAVIIIFVTGRIMGRKESDFNEKIR
jgi:cell shape-determining protein MreD